MKKFVLSVLIIAISGMLLLSACGAQQEMIVAYDPEPTPTPLPKDVSERIELEKKAVDTGSTVNIEGTEYTVWNYADVLSVSKEDLATVPGIKLIQNYAENDVKYVPLTDLSTKYDLGKYTDTQKAHDYFAHSESGVWSYAKGNPVPVVMINSQEDGGPTVDFLSDFFVALNENGFSPIFFEDLGHLSEYDKPVILAFANGFDYLYSDVLPLAMETNVKFSFFQTPDYFGSRGYVTAEQAAEMCASGLVRVESRIPDNEYLSGHSSETQEKLFSEAKMVITRSTGRVPCALIWPEGRCTSDKTGDIADKYFRFGVCESTYGIFNTADDNRRVKCLRIGYYASVEEFIGTISGPFSED